MMNHLIFQLTRGIWAIEPETANGYKPLVQSLLNGRPVKGVVDSDKEAKKESFFVSSAGVRYSFENMDKAPKGSIAVTPLVGAVMKNDFCGSAGTKTLLADMQNADKSENIVAHILYVDSGGGMVDGTMDFSEGIKVLSKPVVTFQDGVMASAAYWIGSSGKHIMASNKLNQTGSIGTYATITDYSKQDEMNGERNIEIYATKSTEKNIEYKEAIKGNLVLMREKVDKINDIFLSSVKRNRFGRSLNTSKTLNGQIYFAEEALQHGLIDSIGSFNDAIKMALKLNK